MSDDPFARLGLPARPWLGVDLIRRAYQERARTLHPDTEGGDAEKFRELGAAFTTVRSVSSRLRALVPRSESTPTPVTDTDLFMRIGSALQASRGFDNPTNPLERALQQVQTRKALTELISVRNAVAKRLTEAEVDLREFDNRWPDVPSNDLLDLAARLGRLENWHRQITEAELALR